MTRQHVELDDLRTSWQRVLIDTKANWVGKVVGELSMELVDITVVCVSRNRNLGLQGSVWDVRSAGEWGGVGLGQERGGSSCSWAYMGQLQFHSRPKHMQGSTEKKG